MATINYLYRSTKKEAYLNMRILFRFDNRDMVIGGKTKLKVAGDYWNRIHVDKKKPRNVDDRNTYNEVNSHLTSLESFVLNRFEDTSPGAVNKDWLSKVVASYYDPESIKAIPLDLVNYIDYYLQRKENDISVMSIRRISVVKKKMQRMEAATGKTILIKEINEDFKLRFQEYYTKEQYSQNTQQREFKMIKSICYHANYNNLEIDPQIKSLTLTPEPAPHIYLTKDEIERISDLEIKEDYLDNSRDWLIISCYTAQRVSDFLRFDKSMIRKTASGHLLEFKQMKTGKLMTIPLLPEVLAVLDKRGGDFPRAISDQKYNDYIKLVAEAAGLHEICKGKKRKNVKPKGEKASYRNVTGNYPKWQLVSSHIGRRSFATNYYGDIPTSVLIGFTGHSSESEFLNYIQKSAEQTALDAFSHFNKLDK